jgi:hypothetical protein
MNLIKFYSLRMGLAFAVLGVGGLVGNPIARRSLDQLVLLGAPHHLLGCLLFRRDNWSSGSQQDAAGPKKGDLEGLNSAKSVQSLFSSLPAPCLCSIGVAEMMEVFNQRSNDP